MSRYDYQDPGTDPVYCDGCSEMPPDDCLWCNQPFEAPEDYPYCSALCAAQAADEDERTERGGRR